MVVNDACLWAVADAPTARTQISNIGDAIRNLDLGKLDQILRELQPLQVSLRQAVVDCKITTRLPNGQVLDSTLPGPLPPSTPSASEPTPTG